MSRKTKKIVSTFWLAFFSVLIFSFCFSFISPSPVQAQTTGTTAATSSSTTSTGIVSCGTSSAPCTLCHLIVGIKALVDWGTKVLATAAILAVVAAGVMYIISSGSTGMMESAKKFLTASLTGFALVVGAWIIVNTVYWLLSASPSTAGVSASNWYTFTCSTSSSALTSTTPSTSSTTSGTTKTADQIAQDLATCNSGCDQAGGDTTTCKQGCTDTANAATKAAAASSTSSTSKDTRSADQIASDCSSWCTNGGYGGGETTDQCNSKCVSDTTASQKAQTASNSTNTSGTSVSSSNCSQINDACNNNSSGVDPKLVKAMLTGGEGCNKSVSSDGYGSCGYSQALPALRTKCGISGTAAESCAAIQNDAQLDANCAAWLINDNAKRCGTDVSGAASCYNSGKANNCANTTKNYCGRVQDAYNKL